MRRSRSGKLFMRGKDRICCEYENASYDYVS